VTPIKEFVQRHPLIAGWIGLAIGMVAILLFAARDVGLLPTQMAVLVVTTIVLAGLCVWIISWE
jgi:predicted tellurium resistance membrane protein TerC